MTSSIAGRTAVVTGATKGIGKGIARVFAGAGAKVLVVARTGDQVEAAVEELRAAGGQAAGCVADIRDWAQVQAMAATAVERFGGIDIVCANAGVFPAAKLADMTGEQWDEVLGVNLKGTFLTIKACLPQLRKSDQGRVILTSSITGPVTGYPGWSHYGASKAGQLGFMRTAAIELARDGITINAILPGNIMTEGLNDLGEDYLQSMATSIPLGRLGDVEDIGHTAVFLASREAGYITGQALIVDGGQTLPESLEALS